MLLFLGWDDVASFISTLAAFLAAVAVLLGGVMWLRNRTREDAVKDQRLQLLEKWVGEHKSCHEDMRRIAGETMQGLAALDAKVGILLDHFEAR